MVAYLENGHTLNDEDRYQTKPKHTIPNNTKIGITRTFLKLQAPDFAWEHIWTMVTLQIMQNHTKSNITKPNQMMQNYTKPNYNQTTTNQTKYY